MGVASSGCCHCNRAAPEISEPTVDFGSKAPTHPLHIDSFNKDHQGDDTDPVQAIDSARSEFAKECERKIDQEKQKKVAEELRASQLKDGEVARSSFAPRASEVRDFKQLVKSESRDEHLFAREWEIAKKLVDILEDSNRDTFEMKMSTRGTLHSVSDDKEGLTLTFPMTFDQAEVLRNHLTRFGASNPVNPRTATALIDQFADKHSELRPNALVRTSVPSNSKGKPGRLIVVGDTHGQLQDVLYIIHEYGAPTAQNVYLFNGDIADRGPNACEIFFLLFSYFLADPASIFINRGNHEDEDMNSQDEEFGGGFRDEVSRKYGATYYWGFLEVMKTLPLATVIGDKVFVVHGGLSCKTDLTLSDISKIDHSTCTIPSYDTEEESEQVWIDLLWADPQDANGVKDSARGVGTLFGPDITATFFRNNQPIELMIRSHQLPDDMKGYMFQKGRKCITIFSASNYCGDSGNTGAVLIFDSDKFPQYQIHDHFAPDLDAMGGLMHSAPQKWRDAGKALKEHQKKRQQDSWNKRELHKMIVSIVEMKPDIWSLFLDKTGGVPMITFKVWREILEEAIGTSWNWEVAGKTWFGDKVNGLINFRDFLQRFRVVVSGESFKFKMVTTVYESIMHSYQNLEETFALFDKDNDGMVDMAEMREVLRSSDVALTPSQIDSLLHTLFECTDPEQMPRVATAEFLGRFTMVFKSAENALAEKHQTAETRLAYEALGKIGMHVASIPYDKLGITPQDLRPIMKASRTAELEHPSSRMSLRASLAVLSEPGEDEKDKDSSSNVRELAYANSGVHVAAKLGSLFEVFDKDRNGSLSHEEFYNGISRIPGLYDIKLSNGERLTEELVRSLAKVVDRVNGGISILELLEALCFEDAGGDNMSDSLAEHILTVLFRHRQAVRSGARVFDRAGTGAIKREDFHRVLEALNDATPGEHSKLLGPQIFRLCESLTQEVSHGKGKVSEIRYEDFFDSFEVLDEDTNTTIKLGKRQASKQ
mmetsp:Transcript_108063/g.170775  ORF Transcript_108063/g.170775 Transcript_108063/m.170775 type:complete len:994 (+) Transcript_108063:69-3050(+)|eukprot:CAMPEP_0169335674 /NCGR_PEP_ID=MMETSP1017-20121227/16456_1 /TAXON_ID=342587 /ORGANISM="Karlodinium micrum, Strain CCMP2283" /LENGTH=993 /DNA_ID=CAMNT_0009431053 /DNA_START=28 /DNA_END=3009 /DNA_ORIENTATION=-